MNSPTVIEIDFAELQDGSLVELIEDASDPAQAVLAVYGDQSVRYTKSLVDWDRILVPLSRADENLRHIRLAQGAEPYGQLDELEVDVGRLLHACLDLEVQWRILITAFVICSWLPERLPVTPYLALVGPPGSGKTTAMRVLNLLCYRSLLTADISSAAFYDISHRIRPTILLDETLTAGNPRELIHLLKASNTPDFVSLRKNKARLAYGPKVFAWLELPKDAVLNSRCVVVPMHRTSRTNLSRPDDPGVLEFAKKVRMRLQHFRFRNYKTISGPKIPSGVQLTGRSLDIYRALSLAFEDQDTDRFLGFLIAHQTIFQAPLLSPAQASTIRVLYDAIHYYPDAPSFKVRALTAAVNSDLTGRGEPAGLNERKLGDILTSLSFTDRIRQNSGYSLLLSRSDRERIHATSATME